MYIMFVKKQTNIVYSQIRIKVSNVRDTMEVYFIHLRKKHFLIRINEMLRKIAQIVFVVFECFCIIRFLV